MKDSHNDREFTIFDILITIAKKKWFIIIFTSIFSIAAVIYALITPEIWGSRSTFITVSDQVSAKGIGASMLGDLGLGLLGNVSSSEALNNIMYLDSRNLKKQAIRKFDMLNYFKITEKDTLKAMEIALQKFDLKVYGSFFDIETESITVHAQTESQYLSKEIVEYFIESLKEYNLTTKTTKGKLQREFLEKRVAEIDSEFDDLLSQLNTFHKETKLISTETQTKQIFSLYSEIIAKDVANDAMISVLQQTYGENSPNYRELLLQRAELKKTITRLESDNTFYKYFVPIDQIPDNLVTSEVLEMRIKINRAIYEFIYPQYEMAKIEEIKDLPTIEIINSADLEGLRIKPKRAMICLITFFMSLIASIFIAVVVDFTSPKNKDKINQAVKIFFKRK